MKISFANIFTFFLLFQLSCKEKQTPKTNNVEVKDTVHVINKEQEEAKKKAIFDSIGGTQKIEKLNKAIEKQFKYSKLNGCILINQSGVDLIKECYGNTCLKCDGGELLTPFSVFQLASISKTFTAIATLKLVEQEKLALNDSVQKFYPEFPYPGVIIEQLLSHRSGLPNYLYAFDDSSRTCKNPDNQKIMTWLAEAKPKRYNLPGKSFSYNNSNYAVLAAVIEKASGKKYTEYIHNAIFKPLKMNHTYVINAIPDSVSKTVGHEWKRIKKDFYDDVLGDKGIYSCTNDLLIWYKSLINHEILSEKTMN